MKNNMFHLKSFLYGEVQIDTWPEYADSDRAAIKQQMQLQEKLVGKTPSEGAESTPEPSSQGDNKTDNKTDKTTDKTADSKTDKTTDNMTDRTTDKTTDKTTDIRIDSRTENKVEPVKLAESGAGKGERNRKRSSCDAEESHSTKKICRGKGEVENNLPLGQGVDVNAKCRKAAEDLKLPFMEKLVVGYTIFCTSI